MFHIIDNNQRIFMVPASNERSATAGARAMGAQGNLRVLGRGELAVAR